MPKAEMKVTWPKDGKAKQESSAPGCRKTMVDKRARVTEREDGSEDVQVDTKLKKDGRFSMPLPPYAYVLGNAQTRRTKQGRTS